MHDTPTTAPQGTFTPGAALLCPDHGGAGSSEPRRAMPHERIAPATCCGAHVAVEADVAIPRLILAQLGTGHLEQTGGMCCAGRVVFFDDTFAMITASEGSIEVGLYVDEERLLGNQPYRTYFTAPNSNGVDSAARRLLTVMMEFCSWSEVTRGRKWECRILEEVVATLESDRYVMAKPPTVDARWSLKMANGCVMPPVIAGAHQREARVAATRLVVSERLSGRL